MPEPDGTSAWNSFWRAVLRFDRGKIRPRIAFRNTVGVVVPLAVLGALGQHALALVGALGALNVAYSDGDDGYGLRARRMLLASCFVALALFAGGLTGRRQVIAIAVAAAWAFCAGMLVSISIPAGDIGSVSLVTLVVFASRPLTARQAALSGLVALGGALFQTGLSLLFWPVRGLASEQETVRGIYGELRVLATTQISPGGAPLATKQFTQARQDLSVQENSPAWERLNALLGQAERIRLRLLTLGRVRRRLGRDPQGRELAHQLDRFAALCAAALGCVEDRLRSAPKASGPAHPPPDATQNLSDAEALLDQLRAGEPSAPSTFLRALIRDAVAQSAALLGQIRAALRMAAAGELPSGDSPRAVAAPFSPRDSFRVRFSVLRANLSFRSFAFRHALRLAVCVAIGDAIGRAFDWQRSYWIPMTIAIVLKPDFVSTFSRGVLRLGGTLIGLTFATFLYSALPPHAWSDVIYVGVFTLALRWVGPANYGIFVIAVSGLVVALIANSGIPPAQVIPLRALNTTAGGVLALLSYALWPTWERSQAGEFLARLLDAYRHYLHWVRRVYVHPDAPDLAQLDRARQLSRLARSNAEASLERLRIEPGVSATLIQDYGAMLVSSHEFIYAVLTLEGAATDDQKAAVPELKRYLDQVDLTLYLLGALLRAGPARFRASDQQASPGRSWPDGSWPDLREEHRRLLAALPEDEYSLLRVETDRMANALNTFHEQVTRWLTTRKRTLPAALSDANLER